eukprot:1137651-Pelagomonas_calceolata.AAC.3
MVVESCPISNRKRCSSCSCSYASINALMLEEVQDHGKLRELQTPLLHASSLRLFTNAALLCWCPLLLPLLLPLQVLPVVPLSTDGGCLANWLPLGQLGG